MKPNRKPREPRFKLLALGLVTCAVAIQCCKGSSHTAKYLKLARLEDDINLVKPHDAKSSAELQIYLLGLFDLRNSAGNECGQFNLDANHDTWRRPMQNLEAFLWAIDQVNADDKLLPGLKLGSIVLDTCSSHLRTVMQLSQFLGADRQGSRANLPAAQQVAAVVNDIADWPTLEATLRILNQIGTTTLVTQNRGSRFERLVEEQAAIHGDTVPMFRTGTSNQQLAEALATLVGHMNWSYVSVVYDDTGDMLDLDERLVEKLAASGCQVALNDKIEPNKLWRLFHRLSVRESLGARVVISLVSPAGAQLLLNHLRTIRKQAQEQASIIGKLLWVTVSDREPYYTAGAEALGTVLVSSSASLPDPFKSHYNGPQAGMNNRWWEEWRRQQLTAATKVLCAGSSGSGGGCGEHPAGQMPWQPVARGWEHNGLSVINAVMIAVQALELARRSGACGAPGEESAASQQCLSQQLHSHSINSLPVIIRNNLTDLSLDSSIRSHAASILSNLQQNHFLLQAGAPSNSQEYKPASRALADGEFLGFNPTTNQLVQNFKIYNLRHLQANSIGFVKFGEFNGRLGMRLNAAKARFYSKAGVKNDHPLDSVISQCLDENKCRLTGAAGSTRMNPQPISSVDVAGGNSASAFGEPSSPAAGVGASLFKLDHPAFTRPAPDEATDGIQEVDQLLHSGSGAIKQFYTMSTGGLSHFNWSQSPPEDLFNVIVLLPLHKTTPPNNNCGGQAPLDIQAFQWLAAIAYAQQQLASSSSTSSSPKPVHLTTTVIDYCGQEEAAKRLLINYLEANEKSMHFGHLGQPISLLDFDSKLADTLHKTLEEEEEEEELTHVTFDRPSSLSNYPPGVASKPEFIFPSEMLEMEALVDLISRVGGRRWKMVHLIFTDSDQYRDRFLNLAILRGICVNKIISVMGWSNGDTSQGSQTSREMYEESIRQILHNNFQTPSNETRILVVLGSQQAEINQLILASATESMLDDYIWVVNHNWIQSIEIQAEKSELTGNQEESIHRSPVNLIGTRLEVLEDLEFRSFLASLNPNKYATQISHQLLDQFWEQNFNCSLPLAGRSKSPASCSSKLQLDPQALDIDYRVPYIIKVITDLNWALQSHKLGTADHNKQYLTPQTYKYGFEIVHRLRSLQTEISRRKQRVQNSRRLVIESNLPLVSVGTWRHNSRLLLKPELEDLGKTPARSPLQGDSEVFESLQNLSSINSSCSSSRSCLSCRKQREHETAINERDRAKLSLNAKSSPKVVDWLPKLTEPQDNDEISASSSSQVLFRFASPEIGSTSSLSSSGQNSKSQPPNRTRYELTSVNGFSITEALVISILSLMSAVFLLFAMAFLYPKAIERKLGPSTRYLTPETMENQLTSINDYFLFAGLLMLCSINIAFLLPATMTICWFRRIGLASSYTVILSSILVMVISCYLRRVSRSKKRASNLSSNVTDVVVSNQENYHVDDEVELTFESLPQEGTSHGAPNSGAQIRQWPEEGRADDDLVMSQLSNNKQPQVNHKPDSSTSLMGLTISLIAVQLLVSLAWSVKQPPEPTLYQGCWRCASPHRSPTLFLYELFLSLVYPALLLLPTWLLSIVTFRSVSADQDQFIKRNLVSSQQTHTQTTLNEVQRLKSQMRDARALVLTTTSLVILWSATTLTILSKSHPLLASTYENNNNHLHEPLAQRLHESILVANLLSACLVYLLLFHYRLRLMGSLRCPNAMLKQHRRVTSKSQHHSASYSGDAGKPSTGQEPMDGPRPRSKSFFSSSQSISSRQELLRLHQFNTYCTYSATSQLPADQTARDAYYSTSGSQRSTGRLRLGAGKIKKRGKTPFFSFPTSSTGPTGDVRSKRKQQNEPRPPSTGGLQRRQSASSVTSSTAQLVFDDSNSISYCADDHDLDEDCDINYLDDTISYTSSVASSSTSQLQGNELYPLDYSIQLDPSQLAPSGGAGSSGEAASSRMLSRLSLRRGSSFRNNTKLSSVTEETPGERKNEPRET